LHCERAFLDSWRAGWLRARADSCRTSRLRARVDSYRPVGHARERASGE
jgi:hypothetical protein